jgi:Flp pilus assembly protein CpaB
MTYRARSLTIASALALAAFVLTIVYVSGYKSNVKRQDANTVVYVASRDILPGTPGAELVDGKALKAVQVRRGDAVSGFVATRRQLAGLVVSQPIYAGEQLSVKRFATKAEEGVPGQIAGKTRAYQLPGDKNQLLVGTLKAGDHVDVLASLHVTVRNAAGEQTDRTVSRIVLRGLLVLQVSTAAHSGALSHSKSDAYVLLALTDVQSQKLFLVVKNGEWSLQLRPGHKARDSAPSADTPESVLLGDLSPAARLRFVTGLPTGGK